jgi:hypothetical protein
VAAPSAHSSNSARSASVMPRPPRAGLEGTSKARPSRMRDLAMNERQLGNSQPWGPRPRGPSSACRSNLDLTC